ncbi:hypothetical protein VTI74DRAFT_7195 [Chaetomium olivicolor]
MKVTRSSGAMGLISRHRIGMDGWPLIEKEKKEEKHTQEKKKKKGEREREREERGRGEWDGRLYSGDLGNPFHTQHTAHCIAMTDW